MAYQNDRTVLCGNDALRYGHVIGERDRGILDNCDRVPLLLEHRIDTFPARAVHKSPVDEGHVVDLTPVFTLLAIVFLFSRFCRGFLRPHESIARGKRYE
jgi:hypothetical protein